MKYLVLTLLGWLLVLLPSPVRAQIAISEIPQDSAMEQHFRTFLNGCAPDEIRCVWFNNNSVQVGMVLTLNLHDGSVATRRDVVDWAVQNSQNTPGALSADNIAEIKKLIATLPASQDIFPFAECVLLAEHSGPTVKVYQYNRINPPLAIQHIYDIAHASIAFGEPDVRDNVTLTMGQTSAYSTFSRPWSVPGVLNWYQQAKTADDRKFWAHVLAASADPRAALALEKNLGQGDNSADPVDLIYFFDHLQALKSHPTLADAQKWLKDNHPRLAAQAALLSPPPNPIPMPVKN